MPYAAEQQRIPVPAMKNNLFGNSPSKGNLTRREMLRISGLGLGALAFECIAGNAKTSNAASLSAFQPRSPHFVSPARAVILLMQNGGPSQMDLFDPKPELKKMEGKVHDEKVEMFQKGSEAN